MPDKSNEIKIGAPGTDERLNSSDTMGETTRSLYTQPPVILEPGVIVLEKFKIIDLLGQGGMGSVYRVEHLLMGRQFALKCLNKFKAEDGAWRRFQNEARAAHLLDHANLLKVYEFGLLPGGQPFFLMELVEGVTLADEIKRLGQLPIERAVKIFIQVAFAISYAHECRVIHRDIKPSNIMVADKKGPDEVETVKVVDFGIAKLTGIDEFNQQTLTKTGEIFGSPLYMSPEQCTGVSVDHRSDLYSLGCVFYETLTSAPPFIGESALSTMMKHQGEKPLSLREASLGTPYPQMLEEIVAKLLEKDPNNRYQSANSLAKDLINLERRLSEESKSTLPSINQAKQVRRAESQKPDKEIILTTPTISLLLASTAVIFALGAYTSYILTGPQKHPKAAANVLVEEKPSASLFDQSKASLPGLQTSGNASKPGNATLSVRQALTRDNPAYDDRVNKSTRWSAVVGDRRIYCFPAKQSLGQLLTGSGDVQEAIAETSLPSSELIGFVPNDYVIQNPALMDKFAPDELTLLDLNSNKLKAAAFIVKIAGFSHLKFLNLYFTSIQTSDLAALRNLKELRALNIGWCGVKCEELLKYLNMQNLQYLDVSGSDQGRLIIENIGKFPKLHQLLICRCNLQDDDLKGLLQSKVRTLCLLWNQDIGDKGIESLSGIKTLLRIDLSNTRVTPEVWKALVKFPHLQKVKVASMKWLPQEKLYFAKQMRIHAPQIEVDFDSNYYKDFSCAVTDIEWLNKGNDLHDSPISAELKENESFFVRKIP